MINKNHYVDLVDGRFSETSRTDLAAAFQSLGASGKNHLVVHFHGGLVSRKSGLEGAEGLYPYYDASAYPFFFVWNSDLLTVLFGDLKDFVSEDLYDHVLKRVIDFVSAKFDKASTPGRAALTPLVVGQTRDLIVPRPGDAAGSAALSEAVRARDKRPVAPEAYVLSRAEEEQILRELHADPQLQAFERGIAVAEAPPAAEAAVRARAPAAAPVRSRISLRIKKEIVESVAQTGLGDARVRAFVSPVTLAMYVLKVVKAILARCWKHTDHGLLATCVEEALRQLYLDNVGIAAWSAIKRDTEQSFGAAEQDGGTAFIEEITAWWKPGKHITLIGHSTGAIYIGHLLERIDRMEPAARVDVILLAPACTFSFLRERLDLLKRRVANIRLFGLQDEVESGYWEVPGIYPRSLLYLVSGLCEGEVDAAVLGMQRYYAGAAPYAGADYGAVADYLNGKLAWSVCADGPGRSSQAKTHGALHEDTTTRQSLANILAHGF